MSLHEPNVHGRYVAAQHRLHELAPAIHPEALMLANIRGAKKLTEHELLGFLLAAEANVKRKEAKLKKEKNSER